MKVKKYIVSIQNYENNSFSGFYVSEHEGWFAGEKRLCSIGKSKEFDSPEDADDFMRKKYKEKYEYEITWIEHNLKE